MNIAHIRALMLLLCALVVMFVLSGQIYMGVRMDCFWGGGKCEDGVLTNLHVRDVELDPWSNYGYYNLRLQLLSHGSYLE